MTYKGGTKKISRRRNSYITSSELAEERTTAYEIGLDYTVYKEIDIKAAINGLLEDKYETDFSSEPFSAFKTHATRKVRSAGGLNGQLVMPWPIIVRLTHWVDAPRPEPVHWSDKATRRDIMHRDGWICGYCLGLARTVEVSGRGRTSSLLALHATRRRMTRHQRKPGWFLSGIPTPERSMLVFNLRCGGS